MSNNNAMKTGEKLLVLSILAVGMLILGIISFRQPLFNEIQEPIPYQQEVAFRYTAKVPEGVYDSTQIEPGEPIFRKLNGSFSVEMDYFFLSTHPADLRGDYRLLAIISDSTGWKRTLELVPTTEFQGNLFTVSETLSLSQIQRLIDVFEKETGVERGRYELAILADIQIDGDLAELPLEDRFLPALYFSITDLEVVLEERTSEGSTLEPSTGNALMRSTYESNVLNILGIKTPVSVARWISILLGVPAWIFLGVLLFQIYQIAEKNEWERTRIWYGSMFIEASDTRILSPPDQIEIASVDDLVNLAEQDQRPIFHILDGDLHHLLVQTPEQNYHYAIEEKQRTGIVVSRPEKETKSRKWYFPRIGEESKVRDAYEHALKGWANAVNHKLYEEGEADRLAEMAYELGKMLDIHGTELENIRMAAYLYKIGLTDVPDEILAKKKKLTKKELEILRSHPTYARNHLDGVELLKPIAEAIYYQHERWDGSGQPDGLKGDQIPIGARVISIVNTWNGLSRARPYRDAWIIEDIRKYFLEQSGKQFDPRIVDLFLTRKDIDYPIVVSAELQAGDEKDA
ncbi:MAG: HD domain-containing protein [Anaerolineae bacterium]|mgnify:FL=1|jgi:HD-GYP domain-containing protein (c-di-GMP phosphodiesterase class II)|nr:HD domain-containing protein [Anaerolineae bacterium]